MGRCRTQRAVDFLEPRTSSIRDALRANSVNRWALIFREFVFILCNNIHCKIFHKESHPLLLFPLFSSFFSPLSSPYSPFSLLLSSPLSPLSQFFCRGFDVDFPRLPGQPGGGGRRYVGIKTFRASLANHARAPFGAGTGAAATDAAYAADGPDDRRE